MTLKSQSQYSLDPVLKEIMYAASHYPQNSVGQNLQQYRDFSIPIKHACNIYNMGSRCVSAISDLNPEIVAS